VSLHRPNLWVHTSISLYLSWALFSPLKTLDIHISLLSPYSHTRIQMHPCMCMHRHTCTPRQMGDLSERSPWSQLGSNIIRDRPMRGVSIRQTHMRSFHPCYYLAARPHLASSAHLYEHTHIYTPYMLAYMQVG